MKSFLEDREKFIVIYKTFLMLFFYNMFLQYIKIVVLLYIFFEENWLQKNWQGKRCSVTFIASNCSNF